MTHYPISPAPAKVAPGRALRLLLSSATLICSAATAASVNASEITIYDFDSIQKFELTNETGMSVALTNYGARIVSIKAPDRNGEFADVTLV